MDRVEEEKPDEPGFHVATSMNRYVYWLLYTSGSFTRLFLIITRS